MKFKVEVDITNKKIIDVVNEAAGKVKEEISKISLEEKSLRLASKKIVKNILKLEYTYEAKDDIPTSRGKIKG